MKQPAITLVHKGAMEIALPAVRSFARHFSASHTLAIHTDGSPGVADEMALLEAADGIDTTIVRPDARKPALDARLADFPLTRKLVSGGGYFAKLQLPMALDPPYFYFDSDIVWLRPATNLVPEKHRNAFSTESWSWYFGVANDRLWLEAKTPRRVNSGFYHLGEPFPFARMEDMLERGMFDPTIPYNTDQEIMAYLFPDMAIYHPADLKRTRVDRHYDLTAETCAALHFPGKMWLPHMDQIAALGGRPALPAMAVRQQEPVPLSRLELARMRTYMALANSSTARRPIDFLRSLRNRLRTVLSR